MSDKPRLNEWGNAGSQLVAAQDHIRVLEAQLTAMREALKYMREWAAQDQSALTANQVAFAMMRMCDDARKAAG